MLCKSSRIFRVWISFTTAFWGWMYHCRQELGTTEWLNCTTVKWWGLCSAEPLDVFAYTNYYQKLRRADQPFYNRVKRPGVSTAIWERRGKDSDGRKEEQVSPTPWWDPSRRFPVSRRDSSCTGLDMTELPREFMKVLSSVIKKMGTKQVMK